MNLDGLGLLLRQLKYFIAVVETRSFIQAAGAGLNAVRNAPEQIKTERLN